MSRFFPHTEYAEDQPLARTILFTHVLNRGFQAGTAIGLLSCASQILLKGQPITVLALVRSAGVGAAVGTGLGGIATMMRMRGREEIEWKDRSWALLENKGQVKVDNWSQPGMVLGAAAVALRKAKAMGNGGWRGILGGAGIGSLIGTVGSMVLGG
ncbi:hypothetical protein EYZ11_000941 [Aspergillus tanneri]|uniref:Uncharacterized protein n=1 Tax=Aspergillus tanneri TaxID=1220188 RepID=A0A4S3JVU4_9EURO|nr:uncharacterized protein ATNIH1004_000241 [Aspergillus tanneri]KAA8651359.1 hypothetical protein ATNIH1004_000241 [Aspergillus tanneri]THC99572.1 hypothetical protein EYZ11_000941 [Aspergillus tanneri]